MEIIETNNCSICGEPLKKETFNPYPLRTTSECCKDCYEKVVEERKALDILSSLPIEVKL